MQEASPDEVAARWNRAMRRGQWEEAWRETDRIELPRREQRARGGLVRGPQHLHWDGTAFTARSVLVRCEHGLGDTLQFIRFVPQIARVAREVHVMIQPALLPLFAGAPGLGTVHDGWAQWPATAHDVEVEIMELAYALRVDLGSLPPPYPHLRERVAGRIGFHLPRDDRLAVGVLWAASDWDRSRSVPLTALEPLLRMPQARFFSLQQGEAAADPLVRQLGIVPLSRHTGAIISAAAAMLEMDLVICVDNMAAHLAGMLGCATWVLLQHQADWRWMEDRTDSPWYPGMRLFRQRRAGDWESVVASVGRALLTRSCRSPA